MQKDPENEGYVHDLQWDSFVERATEGEGDGADDQLKIN